MVSAESSTGNELSNGDADCDPNGYTVKGAETDVDRIAISPNAPHDVPALIEQIASSGMSVSLEDTQARWKLRDAARSLADALETPRERLIRQCWSQVGI